MPEVQCQSENEIFDPEVWGYCLHTETKEFAAFKPTGLIRPRPVRTDLIAFQGLTGSDAGLASSAIKKQTYSLFCTPDKFDTPDSDEGETTSSVQEKLQRLSKLIEIKDRQIKFHHLQRNQASDAVEELQNKLAASLKELEKMHAVLQKVTQKSKSIQKENKELRLCVNQLELHNLTLQEELKCHCKEAEVIKGEGQGFQDGGGEGLSDKSNMSNLPYNEIALRPDSMCFYDNGNGPFISPVKFDMHTPLLWDDVLLKGDKSSNALTTLLITDGVRKSPRSFIVRLRTMMRKFRGKRYNLQE